MDNLDRRAVTLKQGLCGSPWQSGMSQTLVQVWLDIGGAQGLDSGAISGDAVEVSMDAPDAVTATVNLFNLLD